jgi:AcrR family transcriptional regulator
MTADQRREAVLVAAMREFAAGGLAGTSTETIARRAGISHPYLFRLFPTKKALFLAVVERCFARTAATFTEAAEGQAGAPALHAMGQSYLGLLADRDLLLAQLHAYAACADPDVCEATRRGFRQLWDLVTRVSGVSPEEVRQFFAAGMLLNIVAAMDLQRHDEAWAAICMPAKG